MPLSPPKELSLSDLPLLLKTEPSFPIDPKASRTTSTTSVLTFHRGDGTTRPPATPASAASKICEHRAHIPNPISNELTALQPPVKSLP